jgi:hypothetical protein
MSTDGFGHWILAHDFLNNQLDIKILENLIVLSHTRDMQQDTTSSFLNQFVACQALHGHKNLRNCSLSNKINFVPGINGEIQESTETVILDLEINWISPHSFDDLKDSTCTRNLNSIQVWKKLFRGHEK